VVRCRYVEAGVHEVALKFDSPVVTEDYCQTPRILRILLVREDPAITRPAEFHLKQLNVELDIAESGQMAVEMALKGDYEAILMDMDLSVQQGISTTKKLRSMGATAVVVAAASMTQPGDRERFLGCGCDMYVAKPYTRENLIELLDGLSDKSLLSSFRDDPAMTEMISGFISGLPGQIHAIEEAASAGNLEELERLARMLKGEAGGYGFEPITEAAREVENAAIAQEPPEKVMERVSGLVGLGLRVRTSSGPASPHEGAGKESDSKPDESVASSLETQALTD